MFHGKWFASKAPAVRMLGACTMLVLCSMISGFAPGLGHAAITLPPDFVVEDAAPGAGFVEPVTLAFLPDGRMLVGEKRGRLYVVSNGIKHPTPMWSEENRVAGNHDRGLLSVAVDPDYDVNRYVYLLYTADPDSNGTDLGEGFGRVVRYQVSAADSNAFDPASRTVLIGTGWSDGIPSGSTTHSVGTLRFGSDGTLLVSAGDGADFRGIDDGGKHPEMFLPGRVDTLEDIGAYRSLYLGSKAGKILRIDPATGLGLPSNPFYDGDSTSNRSKVYAYGLRNPYRYSVKPGTGSALPSAGDPGVLYVGDVGWRTWEELNVVDQPGMNFGWPCYEGFIETPEYQTTGAPAHNGCDSYGTAYNPTLPSPPVAAYHQTTEGLSTPPGIRGTCSIGGAFYEGTSYPAAYQGNYFIADYSFNWIKVLVTDENDELVTILDFAEDAEGPVDFTPDPVTGDLFYISIYTNEIRRIRYTADPVNSDPIADLDATPSAGVVPLTVYFSSDGSFDPDGDPLTISWQFGDGQGSTSNNPQHEYTTPGSYTAVLTVEDDQGGMARDSTVIVVASQALVFPTTPVLDDFNRPDGPLGSPWVGQIAGFVIENDMLVQDDAWSWGVWDDQIFGDTQEAYFTLDQITASSPEHNLMLKIQGTSWQDGCIEVRYDAIFGHVRVGTYTPGTGWNTYNTFSAPLQAGDQLGARAYPNGLVEVYVNGALIQASSVAGWPFAAGGGRIGMTLVDADTSRIDDFGGGDHREIDLEPSAVTLVPDPPNNAGVTHYLFRLHNRGTTAAPSSRWRLVAGGIMLAEGDTAVAALDSVSIMATVDPILPPGDYDLRITVDTLATVIETNESNNSATREITVFPAAVSVHDGAQRLELSNAFPNPSSGRVRITLSLPRESVVDFTVHDLQGRVVWRASAQQYGPGRHALEWSGASEGRRVRAGLYLARINVDGHVMTRRVAILR